LQAKSGALDSLYNFVRDIAIPEGLHVGRLRSDNGGEYTVKAFRDYCKTAGIKQEFTAPYTPQQHAPIERVWGTLMAVTRCLLQESGLPSVLWPEAFATATYIGNHVPTSSLAGGTPYAAWFGSPASLAHLRVWGARAFVHEERPQPGGKLCIQAGEGCLVQYGEESRTYGIWKRGNRTIVFTWNVTFIESPSCSLPSSPQPSSAT
ncbi:unnamed protein product, partial [Discosporangium mesarthrocarpum]